MTEDASVADIIRDESIEAAEGEEDEGEDGQTKSRSRTPSQSGADDDEEEDEDDGDVFDLDAEDDEYARAYSGLGPAKQAGDASKAGSGARKGYGDDDAEAAKEAAEADAARKAVEEGGWGARTQGEAGGEVGCPCIHWPEPACGLVPSPALRTFAHKVPCPYGTNPHAQRGLKHPRNTLARSRRGPDCPCCGGGGEQGAPRAHRQRRPRPRRPPCLSNGR